MLNSNYAHLHNHNTQSLLDGLGTADQYTKRAKELEFKYLGLTNHGNIDGLIKWQQACDKNEIKPVLGAELYIVPDVTKRAKKEKRGHILILVKNETGWGELCKLMTKANLEGFYIRPRIDYNMLLECDLSGFVISTACGGSFIMMDDGENLLSELVNRNADLYLEIMPHDMPFQNKLHDKLKEIKNHLNIPYLCSNDCFVKDTLILTKQGYKYIQDINTSDYALTHKKNFRKVVNIDKRKLKNDEKIWQLKTPIGSLVSEVTGNHPYRVCNYNYAQKRIRDIRWENVDKLKLGDYLLVPKLKDIYFNTPKALFIDLLKYYKKPHNLRNETYIKNKVQYINTIRVADKNIKIPRFLRIDDDFLLILGMYIANGSEYKNLIGISIHEKKILYLKQIKKYLEQFNLHPELKIIGECAILRFTSSVLAQLFNNICGKYSHNKRLPLELNLDKNQLLKLIEGYILCDGNCGKALMIGATTSLKLAYELCLILNTLGFLSLPYLQKNHLKNKNWRALYCVTLSGDQAYKFSKLVKLEKQYFKPKRIVKRYIEGDDFFAVKLIKKIESKYNDFVYNFEVKEDNSYVANNYIVHNCHYINDKDSMAQEVLLAVQRKAKWNDSNRFKFDFTGLYLRTADEMIEAFEQQGDFTKPEYLLAMRNTIKVAKQCCDFRIPKRDISLPRIPMQSKELTPQEELKNLVDHGLAEILKTKYINEIEYDDYRNRAVFEMGVIERKDFAQYFLIVRELIEWCRKNDIVLGPGRGSSSSSLVAFLIGIVKIDPLKYGLLFERFISEDRCFVGDTKIILNNKVEKIQNAKIGDTVINKYGERDKIKNISRFKTNEKLLKIYFDKKYVLCTCDHKWIVCDEGNNIVVKMSKDLILGKDRLIKISI